jgi:UDP-4-amino-4,6-dideoxy-N-acetyl-beta-L-altrosamine transaminase
MKSIPYGHQWVDEADIKEVEKVLESDWLTQGPQVSKFEKALSVFTGARYVVSVSNGTAALHLACLAAGIGKGDEVITSPLTFVASANCALYCNAKPVFVDIESDTGNIDIEKIAAKITKNTKVIIPVHFSGHPCDLSSLRNIAKKNNLIIIEDAAHALGSFYKNSKIGSCKYSDMTIFSFHPVKTITTGEGGAILTNNKYFYEKLIMLRNHGITKGPGLINKKMSDCGWYYEMQALGFNYRITDIQAALGCSQLKKLDKFIMKRRQIAAIYNKAFKGNNFFDTPKEKDYACSAYHLYPIRLKEKFILRKKEIFQRLRDAGLGVQVHYIPVYLQPYYKKLGYRQNLCPLAESFYQKEISIPMYPGLTKKEINYVIKTIKGVCNDTLL